ncbi:hypothetical protein ACWEO2_21130 [Nocardia sp. NPDC004278]
MSDLSLGDDNTADGQTYLAMESDQGGGGVTGEIAALAVVSKVNGYAAVVGTAQGHSAIVGQATRTGAPLPFGDPFEAGVAGFGETVGVGAVGMTYGVYAAGHDRTGVGVRGEGDTGVHAQGRRLGIVGTGGTPDTRDPVGVDGAVGVVGMGIDAGVRGSAETQTGYGGMFTSTNQAPINLDPKQLSGDFAQETDAVVKAIPPSQTPVDALPSNARAGDLMPLRVESGMCTLWFCVRGDGISDKALWAQVLLGSAFAPIHG